MGTVNYVSTTPRSSETLHVTYGLFPGWPTTVHFQWIQVHLACLNRSTNHDRYYCDYRHDGRHFRSFVMYISGAKFEQRCFHISMDIPDWLLYCFSGVISDLNKGVTKLRHHIRSLWRGPRSDIMLQICFLEKITGDQFFLGDLWETS